MFHYIPASSIATYPYSSSYLSNSRDRYFAALAEAKAAEADYLAAETARREEDELCRRLADIQQRKQERLLRSRYDLVPYNHLNNYPSYDRLAILRQQVEEEERLRLLVLREAEFKERRRQEQAALELEAARLCRAREEALRVHQEEQKEQARLRALLERSLKVAEHDCSCGNQTDCQKPSKQATPVLHPSVRMLLRPEAQVATSVEPKRQAKQEGDIVNALLKGILGLPSETLKPKASAAATTSQPSAVQRESAPKLKIAQESARKPSTTQAGEISHPQKYFERLFKSIGLSLDQLRQPAAQTIPSSKTASDESSETQLFQEFAKLLVPPAAEETTSQSSTSSSSSKPAQDAPAEAAPAAPAPAPAVRKAQASNTPTQSLKEQLEARLNNEFHSEVRDTIQAIFESLRDADNHEPSVLAAPSSKATSSSKGKAKAEESSTTTTSARSSNSTSKDVVDSFNEVRSIEAAFHALETDFTFPATLDFISSHLASSSPASSDSETSTSTTHLAYTSRNHPVRFYEQALSALLAQLDSIDSFGNDTLRAMRKEVVSRVEKALEELEKEVEGRYKTRLAKKAKSVPIETAAVPEVPTTTTSATPDPDSAPAPEPQVEESTSAPAVPSGPELTTPSSEEPSSEPSEPSESPSPTVPTDAEPDLAASEPTIADESFSLSSSSATVKGEIQASDTTPFTVSPSVESASTGAFLLATGPETIPNRPNNNDNDDVASDWSEVDA
ncbi:hypothetical protein C0995_014188 [Termitomyces sp. Mi166|nr:hypothetical protein C0995_014188 [Termitomyces sp. Mi166\